jgi:uncharacterized protein YcfL
MKTVVAIVGLFALTGCSSSSAPPPYKDQNLVIDTHIPAMSRNEVINAISDCEGNGTRAVMIYAKRRINGYTADVVADVTCAPKYRY